MDNENIDTLQKNIVAAMNSFTKDIFQEIETAEKEERSISYANLKDTEQTFTNKIMDEIFNAKGRANKKKGFFSKK